jgi:putative NADH-flavin reductase
VCPPLRLAPGERTGRYRSGSDTVLGDVISLEDFAVAFLDEIEHPRHRRERFAVSS